MIDFYTKTVLSVIAVSLVAIAAQMATRPASAEFSRCGDKPINACIVEIANVKPGGLEVYVTNQK